MSVENRKYAVVICDGDDCGAVFGGPDQYPDIKSARQAALDAGWRLIPKRRSNGRLATVDPYSVVTLALASVAASDVCPGCVPEFRPRSLDWNRPEGASYFTDARSAAERIRKLEAELAMLRRPDVGV